MFWKFIADTFLYHLKICLNSWTTFTYWSLLKKQSLKHFHFSNPLSSDNNVNLFMSLSPYWFICCSTLFWTRNGDTQIKPLRFCLEAASSWSIPTQSYNIGQWEMDQKPINHFLINCTEHLAWATGGSMSVALVVNSKQDWSWCVVFHACMFIVKCLISLRFCICWAINLFCCS